MKLFLLSLFALSASAQLDFLNHNRPLTDAHNCYPEDGQWTDRIDRALRSGYPIGIEQDLAWDNGRIVVSHTPKTTGHEPGLREHFFEKVRPLIEKELASGDRSRWPLIVLHFDFKDNQEPLLRAVWKLLGEYESWITLAPKAANRSELTAMQARPLLVLTEDNDAQEKLFFDEVPVGAQLRLFGSAHTARTEVRDGKERARLAATLAPEKLLTEKPSTYRRWWNNSWAEVEEGGAPRAGEWTPSDEARLKALVDHAHKLGFWIRFYTLDGFNEADNQGWGAGYNFGSRAAAEIRWRAAVKAGVNLIATDHYEALGALISGSPRNP
jgi:hypothetical protein